MDDLRRTLLRWLLANCFVFSGYGLASADLISLAKGDIEGRILENSARVVVIETVAGEYVVLKKNQIQSLVEEPEAEFYVRRGNFHEQNGNDNRALVDYLEALNKIPNHQVARERIEQINYRKKQAKWNTGLQKAEEHFAKQDYWSALEQYQEVLEMEPEETLERRIITRMSEAHTRIAFLYYDHCYDEGAILELAKAEELNPNSAEIYYILGRIHETDRKYDLARLEYERALEIDPFHANARSHLMSLIDQTRRRF